MSRWEVSGEASLVACQLRPGLVADPSHRITAATTELATQLPGSLARLAVPPDSVVNFPGLPAFRGVSPDTSNTSTQSTSVQVLTVKDLGVYTSVRMG
jgi:hypothetical protein